ncbi:hypothetical protein ACWGBY_10075 [Streptomyces griseus]|uniref:hypothetical protein n=1 Tax=Streptomyces TaxID=1883 RepID=UPI001B378CE8|nr:hypothetical protein [Streptomyces sp. C3-3]MBQ1116991.1 hypothetical protein [Streptomyces sp. C3-3]
MKNIALVLLVALLIAVFCERYVLTLGATRLTAAGSGGGAFIGMATIGMLALEQLGTTAA